MEKIKSLSKAAKQIEDLLSAVAKINCVKSPLNTSQIKMLIDSGGPYQKIYISKYNTSIQINKPFDESLYICISVTWIEDDKYIINIK